MKFIVKKHFGKLVPVYNSDAEALKSCKLKEGEEYEVEIKKKRNYEFHKKYFALINLCYENQDQFDNIDDLREEITIEAGYFYEIATLTGEIKKKPKSISFTNMEQITFEDLYKKTIDVVCKFLDVSEQDLLEEIINFM